ncbi:MAG TPA: cyclic nucleotide-binding domain-containing protein [Candidatus Limnocylindria bacterium]|nr:cyclic nucleotide-binding domain-containing protein [Candidatus Limnocylindria bacterium]
MAESLGFGPLALLEKRSRERLRKLATKRRLEPGELLIHERAVPDEAYVLVDGTVRVVGAVELRTLAILSAPALLGELAFVDEHDKSASVVADTPCTVLVLPGAELQRLMDEQPIFATAMRERADLVLADVFLKRHSPLRDLPTAVVAALAAKLRARTFAPSQLIDGGDGDWYLVRRGAVERVHTGERTEAGDFMQREHGARYAALDETWIYELRLEDVAGEIMRHQQHVREIAESIDDRTRFKADPNLVVVRDLALGSAVVRDRHSRAIVSDPVATLARSLDGRRDVASLIESSGLGRGPVIEGLATLVAAGLAKDDSAVLVDFRPD